MFASLNDSFGTTIVITTSVILIVEGSNELKSVQNSRSYFDLCSNFDGF